MEYTYKILNSELWDFGSAVIEVQQKELYLAETGHKIVVRWHYSSDRTVWHQDSE